MDEKEVKKPTKLRRWLILAFLLAALGLAAVMAVRGRSDGDEKTAAPPTEEETVMQAKVIRVEDAGSENNEPMVDIGLLVTDENGDELPATIRLPLKTTPLLRFQPGRTVPVRYDPKNPDKVVLAE